MKANLRIDAHRVRKRPSMHDTVANRGWALTNAETIALVLGQVFDDVTHSVGMSLPGNFSGQGVCV